MVYLKLNEPEVLENFCELYEHVQNEFKCTEIYVEEWVIDQLKGRFETLPKVFYNTGEDER